MGLAEAKRALREACAERRRRAKAAAGKGAGIKAAERFLAGIPLAAGAAVSGYWPIRDEIDPRPLMARLHESGHACALPVVTARGKPLVFRLWSPGMLLEPNAYGISEPPANAALVVPEVLVVPLLAFDAAGYRLGYGAGYYDRTIALLRRSSHDVLAAGLAYGGQEVDELPQEPGDARLDWVVTEREARRIA